jgi:hypothetical protein
MQRSRRAKGQDQIVYLFLAEALSTPVPAKVGDSKNTKKYPKKLSVQISDTISHDKRPNGGHFEATFCRIYGNPLKA